MIINVATFKLARFTALFDFFNLTSAAVPSPIKFYKEHFCDRSSVRPLPVSNAGKRLRAVDSFTFPQNCQIKDQPPLSTLKLMALCSDSSDNSGAALQCIVVTTEVAIWLIAVTFWLSLE